MRKRAWKPLLLAVILCLPLTGCWDQTEIEEEGFVVVIGLDKAVGDDAEGKVDVTFQIANPQVGSTDKATAQNEPASEVITFTAPDFIAAREMASMSVTRQLTFSHTKILVVGEELARSDHFFNQLSSTIRDRQFRRKMNIIVSKERAVEFIKKNIPKLETRPHKFYELMLGRWETTGLVPITDVNRFFSRTEGGMGLFLAAYGTSKPRPHKTGSEDEYRPGELNQKGGGETQIVGGAVFRQGKMIGTVNGEEVRVALLLRSEQKVERMVVTYKDPIKPKFRITVRLYKERQTKIKVDVSTPIPKVDVTVPLTLELLSIPSYIDYVNNLQNQQLLKRSIEEQLTQKMNKYVKRSQQEFQGDPYNWHMEVRKQFWTNDQLKAYNWMEKYPKAQVTIHPEVKIARFGKQMRPPQIEKIRD